jgi:hypothetical protein
MCGLVAVVAIGLMHMTDTVSADFTFSTPINVGSPLNSPYNDGMGSISPDGLTVYIFSDRPGGYGMGDIYVATRATVYGDWGTPVNLGPLINTSGDEWFATISPNGLELYFASKRIGGHGGLDLYVVTRGAISEPWGSRQNLGPAINGPGNDDAARLSQDALTMYYCSCSVWPTSVGSCDIWMTQRPNLSGSWQTPAILSSNVNSPAADAGPVVSVDELTLFLASKRSGTLGGWDLYMTIRPTKDDEWSIPVNLGQPINTANEDPSPFLSHDNSVLFFNSTRPGGIGMYDIWEVPILPVVDFTGDYKVDIEDLIILIENWGQDEPPFDMGPTPLGDGIIDAVDLEVLMSYWGKDVYDPNLIAHWELDESDGDVACDSAGDHDAVVTGDALWQSESGQIDGALQFDGVDDYLVAPFILDPVKQPFSAFAWIKGGQPEQTIVSQKIALGEWLSVDSSGALATGLTFPMPSVTSNVVVTDDQWHRVGLISDGAGMSLYVDGLEVARTDISPILPSTGNLHIGASSDLEAGTFWSGLIDDVLIYDRVVIP